MARATTSTGRLSPRRARPDGPRGSRNPLRRRSAPRGSCARCWRPAPDILLLDEPTNHLDLPAIEWLESEIAGLRSALVLISHDRRFLETLSRSTVWLDRGQHAAHGARLRLLRGMARPGAGRRRARPPQARPQDRRGRALGALRRHRAAQAQCPAHGQPRRACAQERRDARRAVGSVRMARQRGRGERQARHRGNRPR